MASALSLDSVVSRQPDLLTSLVTDEMVMFDMSKGNYYGLEPIGTWIWQRLEGPCSVTGLCDALVERYDVDLPTCRGQVLEFLDGLHREGLIVITSREG